MMMTTNPEYIATEDLAIAKSSVAISCIIVMIMIMMQS